MKHNLTLHVHTAYVRNREKKVIFAKVLADY